MDGKVFSKNKNGWQSSNSYICNKAVDVDGSEKTIIDDGS
jgi:hypothetical protein